MRVLGIWTPVLTFAQQVTFLSISCSAWCLSPFAMTVMILMTSEMNWELHQEDKTQAVHTLHGNSQVTGQPVLSAASMASVLLSTHLRSWVLKSILVPHVRYMLWILCFGEVYWPSVVQLRCLFCKALLEIPGQVRPFLPLWKTTVRNREEKLALKNLLLCF